MSCIRILLEFFRGDREPTLAVPVCVGVVSAAVVMAILVAMALAR